MEAGTLGAKAGPRTYLGPDEALGPEWKHNGGPGMFCARGDHVGIGVHSNPPDTEAGGQ